MMDLSQLSSIKIKIVPMDQRSAELHLETSKLMGIDFLPIGAVAPDEPTLDIIREEHDKDCPHCTTATNHTEILWHTPDLLAREASKRFHLKLVQKMQRPTVQAVSQQEDSPEEFSLSVKYIIRLSGLSPNKQQNLQLQHPC